jgi:hypothetical protein
MSGIPTHPCTAVAQGVSTTEAANLKVVAQLVGGQIRGGGTTFRAVKTTRRRSLNQQVVKETFKPQDQEAEVTPREGEATKKDSATLPQLT